jgi:hypothetical protein
MSSADFRDILYRATIKTHRSALDVVSVCISSAYNLSFQGHIKAEQRKKLNNEKIQTSKQFMHTFCV